MTKQVEEIGKKKEDATDRLKWHDAANKLLRIMRRIWPPLLTETKPDLKHWISISLKQNTFQAVFYSFDDRANT